MLRINTRNILGMVLIGVLYWMSVAPSWAAASGKQPGVTVATQHGATSGGDLCAFLSLSAAGGVFASGSTYFGSVGWRD